VDNLSSTGLGRAGTLPGMILGGGVLLILIVIVVVYAVTHRD
jgi:hypothetical protein